MLVVLSSLLILAAAIAVYAREVALDTAKFTEVSGDLIENDRIRPVLAAYLVDQLYSSVDVPAAVEEILPPDLDRLGPQAAAALRQLAQQTANRLLADPGVQRLWRNATHDAHARFLALIEGRTDVAVQNDGNVVLDLRPLVVEVAQQSGLPGTLLERLPANAGQLLILNQQQVDDARQAADALRKAAFWLLGAAIVLSVASVWLARGRRRETIRSLAVGLVAVALVLVVVRRFVGTAVVDSLVDAASVRPAVEAAWLIATEVLKSVAWMLGAIGLLAILWSWLCGPGRRALAFRRRVGPTLRDHPLALYGVLIAIALLLLAWGPFGHTLGAAGLGIVAAVAAVGIESFRRQAVRDTSS